MNGITVPHSNQYHLGACSAHLAAGHPAEEALAVASGYHLCQPCTRAFHGHLHANPTATAEHAYIAAVNALPAPGLR